MVEINQIYKCNVCGNMIEVIYAGGGKKTCCSQDMELLEAKTRDEGQEKHVPVNAKSDHGFLVKVGSIPHPMEENHYIQWIEVITANKTFRKFLKPGEKPEGNFCAEEKVIMVREYCNIHGLWKNENADK